MSVQPLPLSMTMRMTSTKYLIGLKRLIPFAHTGMLSAGVNSPLKSKKMTKKNQVMNMACCWVSVTVLIKMPNPRMATKYIETNPKRRSVLPAVDIPKNT